LKLISFITRLKDLFKKPGKEQEGEVDGGDVRENSLSDRNKSSHPLFKSYQNLKSYLSIKQMLLYSLTTMALILTGATSGWILVNSEKTVTQRSELTPKLKVDILGEEEGAPKNTSKEPSKLEQATQGTNQKEKIGATSDNNPEKMDDNDLMQGIVYPHVSEETESGILPVIASDGRLPWIEYSRNFKRSDRKPRIAIIISNLGLSSTYTATALKMMPKNVTLSFSHIAPKLKNWIREARQNGFEVLIDLPMEPIGFPQDDPGRDTLLTTLSEVENLNRLEHIMVQAGGFVGLLATHGSKFTLSSEVLLPVLKSIKARGLLYVDSRSTSRSVGSELSSSIQLPRAFNNIFIDKNPSARNINTKLKELEIIAKKKKFALAIAQPLPITLELLNNWIKGLKAKGIALAPVSAIADKQSQR
jgi:uncharacterized protein